LLTLGYEALDLFQFVQFALKQVGFDSLIPSALKWTGRNPLHQIEKSCYVATYSSGPGTARTGVRMVTL
jgi:hypothetical protein